MTKRDMPRLSIAIEAELRRQYRLLCFNEGTTMEKDIHNHIKKRLASSVKKAA